jgi:hypothetical protein
MSYISLRDDIEDRRFEHGAAVTGEYSYSTMSRPRPPRHLPDLTTPEYTVGDILWLDTGYDLVVRTRRRVVMRTLTWDEFDRLCPFRPWQSFVSVMERPTTTL